MPLMSDPEYVSSLRVIELEPRELSDGDWRDINGLMAASVRYDYPDLSLAEAADFAKRVQAKILRRGGLEPGGAPDTYQKHANQRLHVAVDDEKPVATLITSDNASVHRKRGDFIARWTVDAKLNPAFPLSVKRWHYLGERALDPSLIPDEEPAESTDFDVVDLLLFSSTDSEKEMVQPSSVWAWDKELWWRRSVIAAGYVPTGNPVTKHPFGDPDFSPAVSEQHMRAPDVGTVRQFLKNKRNAGTILKSVLYQQPAH